jgi:hypothetical protein
MNRLHAYGARRRFKTSGRRGLLARQYQSALLF